MARQISRGKCSYCQQIVAKNAIAKHLSTCNKRLARLNEPLVGKAKLRHIPLIQLLVEGNGLPQYWMHIEVPADASLNNLDGFLRDIWLECCGHMSAFTVGAQRYAVMPEAGYGERGMAAKVGMIFGPGTVALYEYDFGTTTELTLKYIAEREADYRGYDIGILARNEPPVYKCEVCGEIATKVCSACIWENTGWLCHEHASQHECGEDMLPVVNSPRVGMCAYAGPLR